ncbi:hypothetical protein C8J56DRAFT_1060789 [Mycena floridula]|nr:hypothetical protein C8J56DRAFT_1060789 [Mycena floridula]
MLTATSNRWRSLCFRTANASNIALFRLVRGALQSLTTLNVILLEEERIRTRDRYRASDLGRSLESMPALRTLYGSPLFTPYLSSYLVQKFTGHASRPGLATTVASVTTGILSSPNPSARLSPITSTATACGTSKFAKPRDLFPFHGDWAELHLQFTPKAHN